MIKLSDLIITSRDIIIILIQLKMKLILFASAVLSTMAEAIQLDSNMSLDFSSVDQIPSDLILAQTEVTQSVPDQNQLVERASKAMDKDDKKKMGEEKYSQFHKIKKILKLKNTGMLNLVFRVTIKNYDSPNPKVIDDES